MPILRCSIFLFYQNDSNPNVITFQYVFVIQVLSNLYKRSMTHMYARWKFWLIQSNGERKTLKLHVVFANTIEFMYTFSQLKNNAASMFCWFHMEWPRGVYYRDYLEWAIFEIIQSVQLFFLDLRILQSNTEKIVNHNDRIFKSILHVSQYRRWQIEEFTSAFFFFFSNFHKLEEEVL